MASELPHRENFVFVIRLFSEITIKSAPVRKRWTKLLAQNIRTLGRQLHERTSVVQDWDRIEVCVPSDGAVTREEFLDLLARIPGVANFSEVRSYPLTDIHDIYEKTLDVYRDVLVGKTFSVRVKRNGTHDFSSGDVERYVGGGLRQNTEALGVKLKSPDVTVNIEVKDDRYYVLTDKRPGLGGFPLGTQDPVLSLVSGGFDSTVASYQMIKRGMRTHYCFFNLGGREHEVGVKEIAFYLWKKYGASHRVGFISVPFEGVVAEILTKIGPANMGVVLKRMMLRAAQKIAERGGMQALVTGEALSQVSSQTLSNLSVIDSVCDLLVLRPLIVAAKPDIIDQARQIGVEDFAANIPEYCGVISVKPSANVNVDSLEEEEGKFDFSILDQAITDARRQPIDEVMVDVKRETASVEKVAELPDGAVVVDIRHPTEQDLRPLSCDAHVVLSIPFYTLNGQLESIEPNKRYYLYCDRGVMSELHALHLADMGYANVGVYRPSRDG